MAEPVTLFCHVPEIDLRWRALALELRRSRHAVLPAATWAVTLCAALSARAFAPPSSAAEAQPAVGAPSDQLWPDQATVSVAELYAALGGVADGMRDSAAVQADYERLVDTFDLEDTATLYADYVRVKLAFEATRDAGWWHLSWKITNKKPNSDEIWKQWGKPLALSAAAPVPSAVAECDELSALFAFSARQMGVRGIGLYWPVWNHVVAVWTVQSKEGKPVRIVVPTSQIFLEADDSLGTRGFNPWTQKKIYEYRRRDAKATHTIDVELARFFVGEAARNGNKSQTVLQDERNARDAQLMAALP